MGCKVTKIKGCEIAGSTFSGRTLIFDNRDISGDNFTAKVKSVRSGTITEIIGVKNGSTVFFPFTEIENLKVGVYVIEYWATFAEIGTEPFAAEDFKVLSEGCADCGGTQTQPFTIQFEDVSIPVTIEHSLVNVNNYLNYESLTEAQKAELKGDKGDTGEQGIQGLKGEQGIQGPKGDVGETGAAGAQGIQGVKGDKGDTGAKGDKGENGTSVNVIQATDQANALALSAANPNNIYFWE